MLAEAGLGKLNGSVNLALEAASNAEALLLASGSVDQRNTYVFQVMPWVASESLAQSISYWSTGNGDDTMVTLWNPADEEQDLVFVLSFSGGKYSYPVHLAPRATRMFNISEIINSQIADKDGNVVPTGVHEGSAMVMGSRGPNENILVAMEVGTYSVQKATCPWFCRDCFGMTGDDIEADPFVVGVGGQTQLAMKVQFSSGYEGDYTSTSTWSSSNNGIATVSSGMTTGVAAGSATAKATTQPLSSNPGQVCGAPPGPCPLTPAQGVDLGTVCDFTISPANVIANSCTGTSQNSNNFTTNITPAGNYCLADQVKSTCSENSTGNIDFAVGSPKCVYNLGNPSGNVTYYAGPKLANGTAGTIKMTFNLVFNQTIVTHTGNATVECP